MLAPHQPVEFVDVDGLPWKLRKLKSRAELEKLRKAAAICDATVQEIVATGRLSRRGWWRPLGREDRDAIDHAIRSVGLDPLASRPVNRTGAKASALRLDRCSSNVDVAERRGRGAPSPDPYLLRGFSKPNTPISWRRRELDAGCESV